MADRIVSVDETFTLPAPVRSKLQADIGMTAPAEVLGMTVYNPSEQQEYVNPSGSTLTAIAPATLAVTFTAPASGKVTVEMEAEVTESGGITFWGLISSGTVIESSRVRVCANIALGSGTRCGATVLVEGLTPGASYTYQWATAITAGTLRMRAGGSSVGSALSGPAVMIVRDAPF